MQVPKRSAIKRVSPLREIQTFSTRSERLSASLGEEKKQPAIQIKKGDRSPPKD